MATASLSFKYDQLPTGTSIRLLQNVLNPEGDLQFRLIIEDLEDDPAFKALSYTWGVPNTIFIEDIDQSPKTTKGSQDLQNVADEEVNDEAEVFKIFKAETWRPYESMVENPPRAHSIICNGCHIPITENLHEGFTQVLKLDSPEDGMKYWVDAVCINQQDFRERAAQVAIMGRIYRSADTVIGWLGPSVGYDEFGGTLIGKIFEEIINPESSKTALECGELESLERADILQRLGIFSLLHRLWFRRIWIVQELVLARRVILVFGNGNVLPWEVLEMSLGYLSRHGIHRHIIQTSLHLLKGDSYYEMSRKLSRICLRALGRCPKPKRPWAGLKVDPLESYKFVNDVKELRFQLGQPISRYALKEKNWSRVDFGGFKMCSGGYGRYRVPSGITETTVPRQPKMNISLELLLTMFRSCMSTDPKDKIFALQNILSQLQGAPLIGTLKPNYQTKPQAVYRHVTESIITHSRTLNILSQVQDPSRTSYKDLPSWVPDFSVSTGRKMLCRLDRIIFCASGRKHSSKITFKIVGDTLKAIGVLLDIVADVADLTGCYFLRTAKLATKLPAWYSNEHVRLSSFIQPFLNPNSEPIVIPIYLPSSSTTKHPKRSITRVEAYWRTLLADCIEDRYPAPVEYGFGFASWISWKLEAAQHRLDYARKFKGPDDISVLTDRLYAKLITVSILKSSEHGSFETPCEIEHVVPELLRVVEKEIGKPVEVDLSGGMRFIPGSIGTVEVKRTRDNIVRSVNDTSLRTYCPKVTFPGESVDDTYRRLDAFAERMAEVKDGNRMFRSRDHRLGLGPISTQKGDEVWILDSAAVPFILRPRPDGSRQIIGECYVHGIMNGEALHEDGVKFESVIIA